MQEEKKVVVTIKVEGETLSADESKSLALRFGAKVFDITSAIGCGVREFATPFVVPADVVVPKNMAAEPENPEDMQWTKYTEGRR
jgi:hypothetical protein